MTNMTKTPHKVVVLAPAGNMEKLITAIHYGADAVYLGGNWDVSNVTYFRDMFNNCERFDQDISNWNTAKATDMRSMFQNNKVFNQDLSEWCVPNLYMEQIHYNMFSFGCTNWTEPKPNWGSCPRGENQ